MATIRFNPCPDLASLTTVDQCIQQIEKCKNQLQRAKQNGWPGTAQNKLEKCLYALIERMTQLGTAGIPLKTKRKKRDVI